MRQGGIHIESKNKKSAKKYIALSVAVVALAASVMTLVSAYSCGENVQTNDTAATADTPATPDSPDTPDVIETIETNDEPENPDTSHIVERSGTTLQVPATVWLDVPFYTQTEEMPTGCELVSTRMVLEYFGVKTSYKEIISHLNLCYLQVDDEGRLYGKSPFEAFIGDPYDTTGFGCYPNVIIDMVDDMSTDGLRAEDTSGLPLDFLSETYLNLDIPVLVWVTIEMGESTLTDTWYITDDEGKITEEEYTWRASEHCMVLVGYDEDYYYFNDPLAVEKNVKYKKELVEERYNEVGCYSMILRND